MIRKHIQTAIHCALSLGLLFAPNLPLGAKETLSVAWSHWPPFGQIEADGELGGLDRH